MTPHTADQYDIRSSIWEVVTELEKDKFTKREIAQGLYEVADDLFDDHIENN